MAIDVCFTRPGKRLQFANWEDPPFLVAKSTISTGPFSIAMFVYHRVLRKNADVPFRYVNVYRYISLTANGVSKFHTSVVEHSVPPASTWDFLLASTSRAGFFTRSTNTTQASERIWSMASRARGPVLHGPWRASSHYSLMSKPAVW